MKFDLPSLLGLAAQTVRSPRETAEMLLSLGIPRAALGPALALVIVLTIIFALINEVLLPVGPEVQFTVTPLMLGMLQLTSLLVTAAAMFWIGRAFGGKGHFHEALLLMIWMQFILLCLQVVQTALLLVSTQLASLIAVVSICLFLILLTNFVAVLHGFKSLAKVLMMIILSAFGLVLCLSILLASVGVTLPTVV